VSVSDSFIYLTSIYNNKQIYLHTEDIRAEWISSNSGTQKEKVLFLHQICEREKIKNFYDIGANYGEFSVALSDICEHIHSFEPNLSVYECLKKTSNLYDNINSYNVAVDIDDISKEFHFHRNYSGGGRLKESWRWKDYRYKQFHGEEMYDKYTVSCIDILKFLKNQNEPGNILIKIDIEGNELALINHISKYLLDFEYNWFIYFENNKHVQFSRDTLPGNTLEEHPSDILIGNKSTI
jgi:FkbM family methyltransferase